VSRPDDRIVVAGGWSPFALVPQADAFDLCSDLGPAAALVWILLLTYASRDGGSAFPLHRTLADRSGISRRMLRRHLRALASAGWISRRWEVTATGRRRVYEVHVRSAIPGRAT